MNRKLNTFGYIDEFVNENTRFPLQEGSDRVHHIHIKLGRWIKISFLTILEDFLNPGNHVSLGNNGNLGNHGNLGGVFWKAMA